MTYPSLASPGRGPRRARSHPTLAAALASSLISSIALAQPVPDAPPAAGAAPAEPAVGPLAQIKDDKQLGLALSSITQDPAIPVTDPATRALAQALMIEGVKQLQARAYDQALANFLEAYGKFPSPKILLNIASTLRDMGRLADAANTYQRYLLDPATGPERVAEVKELLIQLDQQLTILTVRVFPSGSEVSIDGGPFIPVGSSLLTRVRSGIHLVRVRKDASSSEVTVNGFEGENKEVAATVTLAAASPQPPDQPKIVVVADPTRPPAANPALDPKLLAAPPEHVDGWLITGTQYTSDGGASNARKTRAGFAGAEIAPIIPRYESTPSGVAILHISDDESISSGVIAVLRVDGEGRGFAGGVGLAISRGHLEGEVMFLRSNSTGGYLGLRYRLLTGWLRPYLGLGIPGFAYDETSAMTGEISKRLAVGLRGAAGVELMINGHFSVQGDLGYEHFFVDPITTGIDNNLLVPTLGVIGRL